MQASRRFRDTQDVPPATCSGCISKLVETVQSAFEQVLMATRYRRFKGPDYHPCLLQVSKNLRAFFKPERGKVNLLDGLP